MENKIILPAEWYPQSAVQLTWPHDETRGTEISVRDVLPGWYEIDFLGGIGYVSSAYIG